MIIKNKKRLKILKQLISIVSIFFIYPSMSQAVSTYESRLNLESSSHVRGTGMGDAYGAVADDLGAVVYNPAGLAGINIPELYFMYNNSFQDLKNINLSFATPIRIKKNLNNIKNCGTIAISIGHVLDKLYDIPSDPTYKISYSDTLITLSYAKKIHELIYIGTNLKYLQEYYNPTTQTKLFSDIGILTKFPSGINLGFTVQNIGGPVKFDTDQKFLYTNYKFAASYEKLFFSSPLLTTFDINFPHEHSGYYCSGLEYWIKDKIALRYGYKSEMQSGSGLSGGLGFKTEKFQIDYSISDYGNIGTMHKISLSTRLGKKNSMKRKTHLLNKGLTYYQEARYIAAITEFAKVLEINNSDSIAIKMLKKSFKKIDETMLALNVPSYPCNPNDDIGKNGIQGLRRVNRAFNNKLTYKRD